MSFRSFQTRDNETRGGHIGVTSLIIHWQISEGREATNIRFLSRQYFLLLYKSPKTSRTSSNMSTTPRFRDPGVHLPFITLLQSFFRNIALKGCLTQR
jgi:hypothetical protein